VSDAKGFGLGFPVGTTYAAAVVHRRAVEWEINH